MGDRGPQLENGFTSIANEILEVVAVTKLSPTQMRIVLIVWRYTYGFRRLFHPMSISFLSRAINGDFRNVQRELTELINRKIISVEYQSGERALGFNKHYTEWVGVGKIAIGETANGETANGENDNGEITNGDIAKGNMAVSPSPPLAVSPTKKERSKEKSKEKRPAGQPPAIRSPAKELLDEYHNLFVARFREKPVISGAKDMELLKKLLGAQSKERISQLLIDFFASEDPFITDSGYTIGVFFVKFNKLLIARVRAEQSAANNPPEPCQCDGRGWYTVFDETANNGAGAHRIRNCSCRKGG